MSIGIMSSYSNALGGLYSGGNTVGSDNQYGTWYNQLYGSKSKVPELNVSDFDYKSKQEELKNQFSNYEKSDKKVQTLKKDSSDFLSNYTSSLTKTGEAAKAVQGKNLDKLIGDVSKGTITDENMKKTTDAMQKLVDSYNGSLKTLSDNTKRGSGVTRQLERMEQALTATSTMNMVGISRGKDGKLAFDQEKFAKEMTKAAKADADTGTTDRMGLLKDVIGGTSSIASAVRQDVSSGLNASATSLVANDLANIQEQKQSGLNLNSFYTRSGAQNMMNMGVVGMLMNISA